MKILRKSKRLGAANAAVLGGLQNKDRKCHGKGSTKKEDDLDCCQTFASQSVWSISRPRLDVPDMSGEASGYDPVHTSTNCQANSGVSCK